MDTETGGLNPQMSSLLDFAVIVCDANFNVQSTFSCKTKPVDGTYQLTAGAMHVNQIDIISHDREASNYTQALESFATFLSPYLFGAKLIPTGWNVKFDIDFIVEHIFDGDRYGWNDVFHYRVFDLQSVARMYSLQGKIPSKVGSLESAARHFGLSERQEHTALGDAYLTLEVAKKLYAL
jgi:DNA polymerase III epsilon subunit-like protein